MSRGPSWTRYDTLMSRWFRRKDGHSACIVVAPFVLGKVVTTWRASLVVVDPEDVLVAVEELGEGRTMAAAQKVAEEWVKRHVGDRPPS